jgi:methionine synthase I (cobalamin-dependent)
MEDPERRLRQLLARHIQFRAEEAANEPLNLAACHQAVSLVRLWAAAGQDWDQPQAFGHFDHLMADIELGPAVIAVSDEELVIAARSAAEAARVLS